VAGTVRDADNGQLLIGATISVDSLGTGAVTDLDGKFRIDQLTPKTYALKVSYVGYDSKLISAVVIKPEETISLDVALSTIKTNTLQEVVVEAELSKENISSLLIARKNSAVVSDAISADMIKKSPDKNTSEVLKRVSGITIQDNKFVIVRGMNDRYNEAMLNGSLLPSSEPDRKTFAFDIFPASIVDNITIIKTSSADLPGDFSGGLVRITTKDIPDNNFISVKAGASYNSLSTFKSYFTYNGGKTDWLGIDDGTRGLPNGFPSHDDYSHLSAAEQVKADQLFINNWAYYQKNSAAPNPTLELTGGFKAGKSNDRLLGGIFALTYNSSQKLIPGERLDYYGYNAAPGDSIYHYVDSAYTHSVLSSALANFSFKLNANNKFSLDNFYSVNSTDQTILRTGNNFTIPSYAKANSFYFASNQIYNSQLSGEHFISKARLKIKWQGYYTSLQRDEPNYRRNLYWTYEPSSPYFCVLSSSPTSSTGAGVQYFGRIIDHAYGADVDVSESFILFHQTQTISAGVLYYHDERTRDVRVLSNIISEPGGFNQSYLFYGQDSIFDPTHFNVTSGLIMFDDNHKTNHYDGSNANTGGYVMLDDKFAERIRLVWGLRLESYHQILNTFDQNNDSLRIDTVYNDFLPSANLILSVLRNANLRLCFSQSVARPSYRELANAVFYDFLTNVTYYGNPALVETHITNYETRWEHYFSNAQYYSVSLFYKKFTNPIEQKNSFPGSDSRSLQFFNAPKATNIGCELEARKDFDFIGKGWENLYAYFNLALINSKVKTTSYQAPDSSTSRPLQGQSPFVINASLQYTEPKSKLGVSLFLNYIGQRLQQVGTITDEPVWEKIHPSLDLKLSKSFLEKGVIEITWSDILHGNDVLYYDLNRNQTFQSSQPAEYTKGDRVISIQHNGYNLSLAVSYRF